MIDTLLKTTQEKNIEYHKKMIRRCFDLVSAPTGTFYVAFLYRSSDWNATIKMLENRPEDALDLLVLTVYSV